MTKAWITLVMRGDSYVPGALVLGQSLRDHKTKHELVVMVTPDVSTEARLLLATVFHRVLPIAYLSAYVTRMATRNQQFIYGEWIHDSFTKFRMLGLTEYEEICFLDADKLFLTNCDELFDVPSPASVWSNVWAEPFAPKTQRAMKNPFVHLKHGDQVPHNLVQNALRMSATEKGEHTFVGGGGVIRLRPNREDMIAYEEALSKFSRREAFGDVNCRSGFDEQSIVWFYRTYRPDLRWTHIHQKYDFFVGRDEWLKEGDMVHEPKCYHYYGHRKPWFKKDPKMKREDEGYREPPIIGKQQRYIIYDPQRLLMKKEEDETYQYQAVWKDLIPWYETLDALRRTLLLDSTLTAEIIDRYTLL